ICNSNFQGCNMTELFQWPGKSPAEPGALEHPAIYHMLDVAAVAELLIAPFAFPNPLRYASVLLIALHDLGKINAGFRRMIRVEVAGSTYRHWEVTEVLLHHYDAFLGSRLGSDRWSREALYAAVAGHHGRPPAQAIRAPKFGRAH